MNELVLITGTSSGIGLASAIACASAGHRVVATMRNLGKRAALESAAAARGLTIDVEQLDVTHEGAAAKVRELILKYGPFYGLVNNAGIAVAGPFEEQTDRDIRDQLETNLLGLMAVTQAVLPSMRAAGRGRIVNISSVSGRVGFPLLSVYAATKHAVEGFSEGLRWEVEPFGIRIVNVEPGNIRTPIFFENQRRAEGMRRDGPYASLIRTIERILQGDVEKAPPAEVVGEEVARLLAHPSPPFRTLVGREARTVVTLRRLLPDRLFSMGMRRALRGEGG